MAFIDLYEADVHLSQCLAAQQTSSKKKEE